MMHHNLAKRLTAGVVVLLGLLLFLQHHTFAGVEPATTTSATKSKTSLCASGGNDDISRTIFAASINAAFIVKR